MTKQRHRVSNTFSFADTLPSPHGAIIVDRSFDSGWPLAHNDACYRTFMHLMVRAHFKESMQGTVVVHRGCFLTTYAQLAAILHKTPDNVKYILEKIKAIGDVETSRVKNQLLIRLPNYNKYQAFLHTKRNNFPSPLPDLSPESTPTLHVNKEGNNENKGYNGNNFNKTREPVDNFEDGGGLKAIGNVLARQMGMRRLPTCEDVKAYRAEQGLQFDVEAFCAYYDNRGWLGTNDKPLKDWKAVAKRWHKREVDKEVAKLKAERGW